MNSNPDRDGCRSLWCAVIEQAVKDRDIPRTGPYAARLKVSSGDWIAAHGGMFDAICDFLELPADKIRKSRMSP